MQRVSVWAYPWDLHDIGLDTALDRISQAGGNCVSLATSYHAGRFLQPGNPRRKVYFPQDGTVYYRLDPTRWKGQKIQALQADSANQRAISDLPERGGPNRIAVRNGQVAAAAMASSAARLALPTTIRVGPSAPPGARGSAIWLMPEKPPSAGSKARGCRPRPATRARAARRPAR